MKDNVSKNSDADLIKEGLFGKNSDIKVKVLNKENAFEGLTDEQIAEIKYESSTTRKDALSCDGKILHEYDYIEIIEDNKTYNAHGVFKGMTGTIWYPIPYKGKWTVLISQLPDGEDQVDILGNHIKIIKTVEEMG